MCFVLQDQIAPISFLSCGSRNANLVFPKVYWTSADAPRRTVFLLLLRKFFFSLAHPLTCTNRWFRPEDPTHPILPLVRDRHHPHQSPAQYQEPRRRSRRVFGARNTLPSDVHKAARRILISIKQTHLYSGTKTTRRDPPTPSRSQPDTARCGVLDKRWPPSSLPCARRPLDEGSKPDARTAGRVAATETHLVDIQTNLPETSPARPARRSASTHASRSKNPCPPSALGCWRDQRPRHFGCRPHHQRPASLSSQERLTGTGAFPAAGLWGASLPLPAWGSLKTLATPLPICLRASREVPPTSTSSCISQRLDCRRIVVQARSPSSPPCSASRLCSLRGTGPSQIRPRPMLRPRRRGGPRRFRWTKFLDGPRRSQSPAAELASAPAAALMPRRPATARRRIGRRPWTGNVTRPRGY